MHASVYVHDKFVKVEKPKPETPKSEENYEDKSIDSELIYQPQKTKIGAVNRMMRKVTNDIRHRALNPGSAST